MKERFQLLTAKHVLIIEPFENKSLEVVTDAAIKDSDESNNSINNLKETHS